MAKKTAKETKTLREVTEEELRTITAGWDVQRVTSMNNWSRSAAPSNPSAGWDTSSVTSMGSVGEDVIKRHRGN